MRKTRRLIRRSLPVLIGCVILLAATGAHAQNGSGPLQQILDTYNNATNGWINQLLGYAQDLFLALAGIEFAWSAIILLFEQRELEGYVAAFIKKLMGVMFFYALLLNGPVWIPAIIQSFTQIGQTVGNTGNLTPDGILQAGINQLGEPVLNAAGSVMQGIDFWHFYQAFERLPWMMLLGAIAVVIILCYVAIAFAFIMTQVEGFIVISAGMFYLGFGGSRWTSSYTERFMATAVTTGIRIMATYLVVGLGQTLAQGTWIPAATTIAGAVRSQEWSTAATDAFTLTAGILIFTALCFRLPKVVGSVITGSPSMSGGDLAAGAATALGGFGAAAGMLAGAGKAAGWAGEKAGSVVSSVGKAAGHGALAPGGAASSLGGGAARSLMSMGSGSSVGSGAKDASQVSPPQFKGFFGQSKQPAPPSSASTGVPGRSSSISSLGKGINGSADVMPPGRASAEVMPSPRNGNAGANGGGTHGSGDSLADSSLSPPVLSNEVGAGPDQSASAVEGVASPPDSLDGAGSLSEVPAASAGADQATSAGAEVPPPMASSRSLGTRAGSGVGAAVQVIGATAHAGGAAGRRATSVGTSAVRVRAKAVELAGMGVAKPAEKLSQGLNFASGALRGLADDGGQPISVEPPTEGSLKGD